MEKTSEHELCLMLNLGIVIVNYNTCALLRSCLQSVYASVGDSTFEVCVVDNASTDSSVEMVTTEFPQALLIANQENVGYPRANNQGLEALGFPASEINPHAPVFALLLNPDTEVPSDGIANMLAFMAEHPEAGVAGPKLIRLDGSLDLACRRSFPTPEIAFYRFIGLAHLFPHNKRFARYNLTYLDPDAEAEVDSVVGAFMLVRGEAISQVGLLDDQFFMYGEDLDWAYRIKAVGWKVFYNPAVTVLHVKRAAARYSDRAQIEFYRAMDIFYRKHYRPTTPRWMDILVICTVGILQRLVRLRTRWASRKNDRIKTEGYI
jgi:GT2 family glycosyltransferase